MLTIATNNAIAVHSSLQTNAMSDVLSVAISAVIVFALGAAIGSFLNVVVYRLPAKLSLLWPPSRCPHCLHRLRLTENIPIFGWLRLKGRCAHCRQPISMRYPLMEAATGTLFLLALGLFGLSLKVLGCWILFSWLLALALIDLDTLTLPNVLTQSGLVLGLGFQLSLGLSNGGSLTQAIPQLVAGDRLMTGGVLGAVLGLWVLELIALVGSLLIGKTAMGGGDPKLTAMIGAWLGWKYMLVGGFLACVIGAFVGGGAIALGWLKRRQPMPFGPFLALGAVLSTLWGEKLLAAYLNWFFPSLS